MESPTASSPTSLKLKIKLGPNMRAEPANARVIPVKEEEGTPMKIIIKKNSAVIPPVVNDKVMLNLIPYPNVSNKSTFKKACSCTSFEQLEKWSEKDLNQLGEELDQMRKTFKDFTASIQSQMEMLENWRQKTDRDQKPSKKDAAATPLAVTPKQQPQTPTQAHNLTDNLANAETPPPPGRPRVKKPNQNKKRKGADSDSGDDYKKDEEEGSDSASEDEIDVVDIDDAPDSEAATPGTVKNKKSAGAAQKKGEVKKKTAGNNRRNKQKQTRQSARERKKSRKGEEMDSSADEGGKGGKWPNTNFWRDMESFFAPFTQDDLKFCQPQSIDYDDAAFQIPPLGKHFSSEYEGEDDEDGYDTRARQAYRQPPPPSPPHVNQVDESDKPPSCGDLTSRILAALIEENVVPPAVQMTITQPPPPMESLRKEEDGDTKMSDVEMPDVNPQIPASSVEQSLPLETPPTYDFSAHTMVSLEDRIKAELKSIGLLEGWDLDIDNNAREDDEICSELRKLQKELKDQILANNTFRSKLAPLIAESVAREEQVKKDRAANAQLEKTYLKVMRKKKRGKSTPGKAE